MDFDDIIRGAFGEDSEDASESTELVVELSDLLERYALPHEGVLYVLHLAMDVLLPLARMRTFADRCEAEQVVRAGFRRELEMLMARHLNSAAQDTK